MRNQVQLIAYPDRLGGSLRGLARSTTSTSWADVPAAGLWAAALALAGLTLLAPSQPGYDAWAWLVWGRELAAGELDTVAGPAWKPLPVAVTAVLAPLGEAAPPLWLVVARAGAIAAVLLAGRVAWRLAGRSWPAAILAGGGVALSAGWWWHAAVGQAEGLFVAFALAALDRALAGRTRAALGLGWAAALIRPESWPFLGLFAAWLWRRERALRPLVGAALVTVGLAWFLPDWLASGDPWRSGERARVPNPGAPALAPRPALASLERAAAIPLAPIAGAALIPLAALAGGRAGARRAALPAVAGVAWIALVAAMAEAGYSGEARYALPGAAAMAVSGGVGLAWAVGAARRRGERLGTAAVVVLGLGLATLVLPGRLGSVGGELRRAGDDAALWASLDEAVAAAGGRAAVLACGRPVTGPYRGPGVAWALRVHKRVVTFEPALGGAVLRSRIRPGTAVEPAAPPGSHVAGRSERWEVRLC